MTFDYPVTHNPSSSRFEVSLPGDPAVLVYLLKRELFIILHTEVPAGFEGKGIAAHLTTEALNYARKKGYKVRSYCAYTTGFIERHPEYQELLG
jgi:predicted GNAT family acetyltransferase